MMDDPKVKGNHSTDLNFCRSLQIVEADLFSYSKSYLKQHDRLQDQNKNGFIHKQCMQVIPMWIRDECETWSWEPAGEEIFRTRQNTTGCVLFTSSCSHLHNDRIIGSLTTVGPCYYKQVDNVHHVSGMCRFA